MEKHLVKAEKRDVRDAISVQSARNSGELHSKSKDGDFEIKHTMPASIWFSPILSRVPTDQFDQQAWENYWQAWANTFDKFRGKRTHRDKMFI